MNKKSLLILLFIFIGGFAFSQNSLPAVDLKTLDGQIIAVPGEMSVAAALLAVGKIISRISPTSKKPCSPHCLIFRPDIWIEFICV